MSVEKFKAAKKDLQYSYDLMEKMRPQPQMAGMEQNAPMEEGMPQEAPMEPEMAQEAPVEPQEEQKGIIDGVVEAIKPMFEKLKDSFATKMEEPKDAKITLDATVESKEKESETS